MKKIFYVLLLTVVTLVSFCQDTLNSQIGFRNTHAFIPNDTSLTTYFYSSPNGKIIDSLKMPSDSLWIILTIDYEQNDWVKLSSIRVFPDFDYPSLSVKTNHNEVREVWVPIHILYTTLNDPTSTFSVYDLPDVNSLQVLYETEFSRKFNFVKIKGGWVKLKFFINGKEYVGWFEKESTCGYFWTTCGYH